MKPEEEESRKRGALWWWSFPAATGLLVAVFGGMLLFGGDDDGTSSAAGDVVAPTSTVPFEPVGFTDRTDDDPTVEGPDEVGLDPFMGPADRAAEFAEELPEETPVGLYGGTLENTCDPDKLIAYLQANPAKAQAWATVQGIQVTDIAAFISALTPVVLTVDTAVTNHSFTNGVAVPVQATLQAGTAVLVDSSGVPRVRCYCGNPLLPPQDPPPPPPTMTLCWADGSLVREWDDVESPVVAQTILGGEYVKVLNVGIHSDGGWGYEVEIQRTGERGWINIGAVRCNAVCATVTVATPTLGPASDGSTSINPGTVVYLTGVTSTAGAAGPSSLVHWGSDPAVGWVTTSLLTPATCAPGECLVLGAPLYVGFGAAPSTFLGTNALTTPRPWAVTPTGNTQTIGGVVYVELPVWFDAGWVHSQGGGGYTEIWTELAYLDGSMCNDEPVCFDPATSGPILQDPTGTATWAFPLTTARLTGQSRVVTNPLGLWFQIEFIHVDFEPEFVYGWVQFPPQGPECAAEPVCLNPVGGAVTTYPMPEAFGGTSWGASAIQATATGYAEYDSNGTLFRQVQFTQGGVQQTAYATLATMSSGVCVTSPPPPSTCSPAQLHDPSLTYQVINVAPNDPDGGLVIHTQPGLTTPSTGVLVYNSTGNAVVGCSVTSDGIVWWELAQGGWVSAAYLAPDTTAAPTCSAGPFDPTGKNVKASPTGQFEGTTFPGQSPNPDTAYVFEQGGRSYVQFELGDGSVSSVLDLGISIHGQARDISYANTVTNLGTPGDIIYVRDISEAGGSVAGYSLLVHLNGCDPERLEDPAGVVIESLEQASAVDLNSMNCEFGSPATTILFTVGTATGNGPGDYDYQTNQAAYNGGTMLVSQGQGQGQGLPPGQPC